MTINPQNPDFSNTPVSDRRPAFGYTPVEPNASPVVTIVTPFYNTGVVFHDTARSVLNQSLQQWEWLIVNDGSTEPQALQVLNQYRNGDARIRVIDHDTNRGPSAARNTGFRCATADYVAQLDSDDLLEPTALEKWRWFLESYPEYSFVKGYSVGFGAQEYLWTKGFHNGASFLDENLTDIFCMMRKPLHCEVGGYDETLRTGLEDWDFWLRCASQGSWGATIPEYHGWYRRRFNHHERWRTWDASEAQASFIARQRRKYDRLWQDGFPNVRLRWHLPHDSVPDHLPFANPLAKSQPRLVMLLPWLTMGGSDKFNLDALKHLTRRGWQITIVATERSDNSWLPEFARFTPDIFVLSNFLRLVDYPRFLRYLIQSRGADALFISNSEFSYLLLPYLRAHFPQVPIVDMCHMEQEDWKNGGHPRAAVDYQELLDLNIVSSQHLKDWMVRRGAEADKIRVLYTNIDIEAYQRPQALTTRAELGLAPEDMVILYAARLVEQKQPRVFAQTMLRLRQSNIRFVALVAGDGPDGPWLRNFINDHQLQANVRWLGALPNDRVRDLMLISDIFFLPSKMEGIALSLFEAMACGLPVVAARVGGQAELVTPDCGLLLELGDETAEVERYADALLRLVNAPDERCRMGQAGRTRVATHFRIETMADTLSDILAEAQMRRAKVTSPQLGLGLARACASLAVEHTRLFNLAEQLWFERGTAPDLASHLAAAPVPSRRSRFYQLLRWQLLPAYQWGVQQRWTWLTRLKDLVKGLLLTNVKRERI